MNEIGENPLSASERKLLSIARQLGPIARSEVTAHSGLSQQSVHRHIDSLQSRGPNPKLRFNGPTYRSSF